ncbi:hypothetical protein WICMUC_004680 [Wickerhamomyces mucosus]|uniref:Deacetylase sirtuin-type domain-containing protein n=1 Tax=Wickerhamomyces mucosus TaxID=1378264 RepID=A0A9P8PFL4_9ASCO|nr:hypothetical protein WICMUC_004680 [Wickerhamomyces mucosus]
MSDNTGAFHKRPTTGDPNPWDSNGDANIYSHSNKLPKTNSNQTPSNTHIVSLSSDDSDDSGESDESEDEIKPSSLSKLYKVKRINDEYILPDIPKHLIEDAKEYLRGDGIEEFLEKYLVSDPTASDLLYIVCLLGFNDFKIPSNSFKDDTALFYDALKLLQNAANKVLNSRPRLKEIDSFEKTVEIIDKAKKIIVLTGAGVSTSLGIPDFRSDKGIYSIIKDLPLDDPQDLFSLPYFRQDPEVFYSSAYLVLPPVGLYTPFHAFLKQLEVRGKLLRNYTQNIDNLEANAGIDPSKFIQCHGSFATASCQTCKRRIDGKRIFKYIQNKELPVCPKCSAERKRRFEKNPDYQPRSFGLMKPDITFFGEDLPERYHTNIFKDISECDLLITVGTSLKVSPISDIVNKIPRDIPQILINKDLVDHAVFDSSILGYCDQAAVCIAKRLGWNLDHSDFKKISNSGLTVSNVDQENGIYTIKDAEELQKDKLENS